MPITSTALTDVGLHREHNEDAFVWRPDAGVFAVADGMGGHAAGEVASRIAASVIEAWQPHGNADANARSLSEAVTRANREILRHAQNHPECSGMGTTLTTMYLKDSSAIVAHVGDSRLYRLNGGRLEQITRDHTWVQDQVDRGALSAREARVHPMSSILTRALGTDEAVAVDAFDVPVSPGDKLLLCSDGLNGMIDDAQIADVLSTAGSVEDIARQLIAQANSFGGRDNITVVVVQVS